MKRTIRIMRIGVISAAFRGLLIGGAIGFILGAIGAFFWALFTSLLTIASGIDLTGAGYGMLVLLPLGGMMALGSLWMSVAFLVALFYNITAGVFGGVPVEVQDDALAAYSVVSGNTGDNASLPDEPLPPDSVMRTE